LLDFRITERKTDKSNGFIYWLRRRLDPDIYPSS
jgi:hypothetical protein